PREPSPRGRPARSSSGMRDRTTPRARPRLRQDAVGEDPVEEAQVEARNAVPPDEEVADLRPAAEGPRDLLDHQDLALRNRHPRAHTSAPRAHVLRDRRLLLDLAGGGIRPLQAEVQVHLAALVLPPLLLAGDRRKGIVGKEEASARVQLVAL